MTGFANDLRFCREAAGLSLSAAAKAAGITKAHLHDMESGRARNPGVSTLAGLARAYGQNVGWMAERAALALSSEVQPVSPSEASAGNLPPDAPIPSPKTPESGDGWRPTHRHWERGTEYRVLGMGALQSQMPLSDMAVVVIYEGQDGMLWARARAEFFDGRFEPLPPPPETKQEGGK